ncbi:MAG: hypothetical protein KAS32_00685 [Candidatus Peribacteraceae bacterium]|nr:hypothetical protein [Candidatus Peribacteraceae bacterium]
MKKLVLFLILNLYTFNALAAEPIDPSIEPYTDTVCDWPLLRADDEPFLVEDRGGVNLYRSNISGVWGADKRIATNYTDCAFTIDNTTLSSGIHYFVATAFDTRGRESDYSVEFTHVIKWPPLPPKPPTGLTRAPVAQN